MFYTTWGCWIFFCIFCNPMCVLGMYIHLRWYANKKKKSLIILRRCAERPEPSLFPSKATYIKLLCIVIEHAWLMVEEIGDKRLYIKRKRERERERESVSACVLACSFTIQSFGRSFICGLTWKQGWLRPFCASSQYEQILLFRIYSILSHNLGRSSGHHRWICNNPFTSVTAVL